MESDITQELFKLKKQVDSLPTPEVSIWVDWTPTVTQNTAVSISIIFARYTVIHKTVHIRARIQMTGAGGGNNSILVAGFPHNISNVGGIIGTMLVTDTGVGFYQGALSVNSATGAVGRAHGQTSNIGATPAFTLASGDFIDIVGTYERT